VSEVLNLLAPSDRTQPLVVDATVGYGGHAEAMLTAWPSARLLGIDRDLEAPRKPVLELDGERDVARDGELDTRVAREHFARESRDARGDRSVFDPGEAAQSEARGLADTDAPERFFGPVSTTFSNPIGGKRAWCGGTIGTPTSLASMSSRRPSSSSIPTNSPGWTPSSPSASRTGLPEMKPDVWCVIGPVERSAPLMSSGVGLRPPPPSLLRCAEHPVVPIRERRGFSAIPMPRRTSPRVEGGRHSEVKKEGRAQPGPGDMSGVGHPSPLSARRPSANIAFHPSQPTHGGEEN
jgi:hypothetical protein